MSLDGAIDAPTWTFDFEFLPQMGEAIGGGHGAQPRHPAWAHDLRDVRAGVVDADRGGRSRSAVLRSSGRTPDAIRSLKDEVGDLYVSGSGTLVRAMLADGLIDELRLFVYPVARGPGPRLFLEEAAPAKLSLAACESYENGVVYLSYDRRPEARTTILMRLGRCGLR
jgi:riboflavin biosynthesis pyrimidine reductase